MIPLPWWLNRFVLAGGQHVVKRGRQLLLRYWKRIIDHLVLMPNGAVALFRNKIFDAVVGFGSNSPFPLEIEVVILIVRNDVASVHAGGHLLQDALFNDPAFFGKGFLFKAPPARSRLAVKQQPPTGCFLGRC